MELELHVVRMGQTGAPPLVILHGWRQSIAVMRPLAELLSDIADIHLIDLPGFGQSPLPDEVWGTQDYAARLVRYLDAQNIPNADFLGHSFGGKTSIKLAATHPSRVGRVVLIDTSGIPSNPPFKRRMKIRAVKTLRAVLRFLKRFGVPWYDSWFVHRFGSADYKAATGNMRSTFVRVVNEDLTPELGRIKAPTLLLWGELDTETPLEVGERLSKLIPNARLIALPGKDHYPFLGAGASVCAFHIREFLDNTPVARAQGDV